MVEKITRIIPDWVLIKVPQPNDEVSVGDTKLFIATKFNPDRYRQVHGEVVDCSDSNVVQGDVIYFHYLTLLAAQRDKGMVFTEDDQEYAFIRLDSCFFYRRGDDFHMLHNHLLVVDYELVNKPVSDVVETVELTPGRGAGYATIAHAPAAPDPNLSLSPGDRVVLSTSSDVPLENELVQKLNKRYYRITFDDVLAKVL